MGARVDPADALGEQEVARTGGTKRTSVSDAGTDLVRHGENAEGKSCVPCGSPNNALHRTGDRVARSGR